MLSVEQRNQWAKALADHICESWGWLEGDPEAIQLGMNIAYSLEILVANTRTSPEALVQALLPLGAVPSGHNSYVTSGNNEIYKIKERT